MNENELIERFAEWNPGPVIRMRDDLIIISSNAAAKMAFCQKNHEGPCGYDYCCCSAGEKITDLLPGLEADDNFKKWQDNKEQTLLYSTEKKVNDRYFQFIFKNIPEDCIYIYGNDITELKRILLLKEDIDRILIHDLKNPLSGIMGISELLLAEQLPASHKEMVEAIFISSRKMAKMVSKYLDLLKMELGTYVLQKEKIDLVNLFIGLTHEFNGFSRKKGVTLALLLGDKILQDSDQMVIEADESDLVNLFENLLKNAIEASPEGGTVTVRLENQDDKNINIILHNQGVVPDEIRDHFFERYATSGKEGGTGLGTYSAMLIAKSHKGNITFKSSPQEGTSLVVSLPVR